jgi:hypothetical protein
MMNFSPGAQKPSRAVDVVSRQKYDTGSFFRLIRPWLQAYIVASFFKDSSSETV